MQMNNPAHQASLILQSRSRPSKCELTGTVRLLGTLHLDNEPSLSKCTLTTQLGSGANHHDYSVDLPGKCALTDHVSTDTGCHITAESYGKSQLRFELALSIGIGFLNSFFNLTTLPGRMNPEMIDNSKFALTALPRSSNGNAGTPPGKCALTSLPDLIANLIVVRFGKCELTNHHKTATVCSDHPAYQTGHMQNQNECASSRRNPIELSPPAGYVSSGNLTICCINRTAPPGRRKRTEHSPPRPPRNPRGFFIGTRKTNFARLDQTGPGGRSAFGERK